MQNAIGTAGTQAAGLWEFNADGTMSKHLHPGKAAFNGVLAADLANAGFTGAGRILEGERGFMRAMSASRDIGALTRDLGTRWKISENCYKVWACCGHTHSAIDIVVDLRAQRRQRSGRIDPAEVASIEIETYGPGYEIVNERHPSTPYAAKFSLAYCVAAALAYGGAPLDAFSPGHFSEQGVVDANIAALLDRTSVTVADDLTAKYPHAWPARVNIAFADGTMLRGTSDYPVGNPENPVTTAQLREKFSALVAPRWGARATARAIASLDSLESCRDMADTFRDFVPEPGSDRALASAVHAR
jgi:2-methylcitrate dehydratase PrpD